MESAYVVKLFNTDGTVCDLANTNDLANAIVVYNAIKTANFYQIGTRIAVCMTGNKEPILNDVISGEKTDQLALLNDVVLAERRINCWFGAMMPMPESV